MRRTLGLCVLLFVSELFGGTIRLADYPAGARNVVVPLYEPAAARPVGLLRAKQIFQDYERRGFFRIGALPLIAVQEMALEISDASQTPAVLQRVASHLTSARNSKLAFEARDFSIILRGQTNALLSARRMRLEGPGTLRLHDVVLPSDTARKFRRATLHISGPRAGEITADTPQGELSLRLSDLVHPDSVPSPNARL